METARTGRRQDSSDNISSAQEVPSAASLDAAGTAARGTAADSDTLSHGQAFTEQDVGRIIALASQLQAEKRHSKKDATAVSGAELHSLAAQFGIDEDCLRQAIVLSEQTARSIVLKGSLDNVRNRILTRFANVHVKRPDRPMQTITPRLLVEGGGGIEIQWADRRLTIRLLEKAPGLIRVEWDTDIGDSGRRYAREIGILLGTVFTFTVAGLLAATGSLALAGAGIAGTALAFVAASKQMRKRMESEFDEMCTTELKNMEVLGFEPERT